jgi:hypothetical protein
LHALNAKEEITRRQKISRQRPINWNSVNTADFVANIRPTERANRYPAVVPLLEDLLILSVKGNLGDQPASTHNTFFKMQASSSNGRASDSKSGGWGFESLLACHFLF